MDYARKRPLWQWLTLYLFLGALVYGLVYFFLLRPVAPSQKAAPAGAVMPDLSRAAISISNSGFVPNSVTIKTGGTVTWENQAGANANVSSSPHPAHTDYPPLNLGDIAPGKSVSLKFPAAGVYHFHNHLDASQFGSVTVQ